MRGGAGNARWRRSWSGRVRTEAHLGRSRNRRTSEPLDLLVKTELPYGQYKGEVIADLPGNYLNWFAREGFLPGQLGRLLALMHETDRSGLKHRLQPLRGRASGDQ